MKQTNRLNLGTIAFGVLNFLLVLKGRFDLIKIKARLKKFDIAFYHFEKVVNEGWCGKWFAEQIEKQMIHGGEFEGMLQFNSELFTKILTKSQKGKY